MAGRAIETAQALACGLGADGIGRAPTALLGGIDYRLHETVAAPLAPHPTPPPDRVPLRV